MTKVDKVPKTQREARIGDHLRAMDVRLPDDTAVVLTSASEGFGRDEVLAWLDDRLAARAA
jgi:GTP-binding protein EngB required for normal cell division